MATHPAPGVASASRASARRAPRRRPRTKYRLGVVGFAHMHVNELIARFMDLEGVELVACADTVPEVPSSTDVAGSRRANLRRALEHHHRPQEYGDYLEMLDREELDIAIFCPEISRHAEVAEALAAHGVHMVTEKPMAGTLVDGQRMARAARDADVVLMVNWPTTWSPAIRKVKDLVDARLIGDVWGVKWRNGPSLGPLAPGSRHPGDTVVSGALTDEEKAAEWWYRPAAGGGALLDYCSYGACLATWYLGQQAVAVQALTTNVMSPFGAVEDNAVLLMQYQQAHAIAEGSWTTVHTGVPSGPVLYGTAGTIVVDGERLSVFREPDRPEPTQTLVGDALGAGDATIAEVFIGHIESGTPPHPTLDLPINLTATAVLDAGIRSAASGAVEPVGDVSGGVA